MDHLEALGQNKKEKIRRSKRDAQNVGYLLICQPLHAHQPINKNIKECLVYVFK